ncbi:putative adenylyltransferase/sulfurtransferase MoeZ [Rosistilla oblonga]|uniref:Putative adenylyltransferase/sulfurtransferase MoeZ n=1 Tax=Rosistilla oblonga TaxID=2527990 RepID=A0A518IWX5_9BACT|nr:rhodanese-like domain-containing protein [Rosistilla oblonga]QDV14277.1 putative adenylyltransferase/sulfurtransferase MoeZ [Rosistilla oblonga]QDV57576.1 putative adenylyltransferase/sulfurtransferase MoeZ [Rosistilla oblonga]
MQSPEHEALPIEVDVATVKSMLDQNADFVLIDCREADEYQVAKIDGSILIPLSELQEKGAELEAHRDRHIIVHCHHGGRSMRLTQILLANGFPRVQNMAGGIDVWSQQIDSSVPRY